MSGSIVGVCEGIFEVVLGVSVIEVDDSAAVVDWISIFCSCVTL